MTARTRLVLVPALPPLAAFVFICGFFAAEAAGFRPLSGEPANLSEAAAIGAAARALQLIAAGQNPNQPYAIGAGVLGSTSYSVDAIDAAILGRRPEMIPVLRQHGAVVTNLQRSICLALATESPEVLPLIGAPSASAGRGTSENRDDAIQVCLTDVNLR